MKPTLFILAAGMASRYGSNKQMDGLGPSGEILMDYSVFDAIRAGFGRAVFVIGRHFENDFREKVLSKYAGKIETDLVFQSLDALPPPFAPPEGRTKPWGTNHAVLMGRDAIKEPFLVINADDFYGLDTFESAAGFLSAEPKPGEYCMIGFRIKNTMSDKGSVSRGVCKVGADGYLEKITEHKELVWENGAIKSMDTGETFAPETMVSMNAYGFTPDYFERSAEYFEKTFLPENLDVPKSEFYIPTMVDVLIKEGKARVKCIETGAKWFGVTYADDRPAVVRKLRDLADAGEYPEKLF